ncbi:MAG: DUF1361 domain-containing protein [Chitinophagaceae bacterium]
MKSFFKHYLYQPQHLALMGLSVFGIFLFIIRMIVSSSTHYFFLNWNLFLAFIPYFFSIYLLQQQHSKPSKLRSVMLIASWLLFFPNAPYILTDLFHLRLQSIVPTWFDLILILSYAITGLMLGFLAMVNIEQYVKHIVSKRQLHILRVLALFVASFGVYIGRFLRWNSWDVFVNPTHVGQDIVDRVINPLHHTQTWAFTLFMGILLNLCYLLFKNFSHSTLYR